jgi:hypothetical protein
MYTEVVLGRPRSLSAPHMCSGLQQNGVLFYRRQSDFVNTYLLSARLSFYSVFPGISDRKSVPGFQCRTAADVYVRLATPSLAWGVRRVEPLVTTY